MQNNYNLLRPLNREAVEAGEPVCWVNDGTQLFEASMSKAGRISGKWNKNDIYEESWNVIDSANCFRMRPLTWVEGKPVYKGDILYSKVNIGEARIVERVDENNRLFASNTTSHGPATEEYFTWEKPKEVVGWVVIKESDQVCATLYADKVTALKYLYKTEAEARTFHPDALAIIKVEV